jgi:predicted nuclease with TOPRIM domain
VRQRKQLEEKQSELQSTEAVLNEEVCRLQEKLGESKMNFETATKEKNAARLKNKETLSNEQKQVHENKTYAVRFEVLTTVIVRIAVFWNEALCSLTRCVVVSEDSAASVIRVNKITF